MISHRVVGIHYSNGVPHLKVGCYSNSFAQTSLKSLVFIRTILCGNWNSGVRLNFETPRDFLKYLWYVNGVECGSDPFLLYLPLEDGVGLVGNVGVCSGIACRPFYRDLCHRDLLSPAAYEV